MKYIKHSKFRNTGLIFELLVRQIAADTIARSESPAVRILEKYYNEKSVVGREYKLYEFISKYTKLSTDKADLVLKAILESSQKLDQQKLKQRKYELVKELSSSYNLDEFFTIKVKEYKPYAALYCLLELYNTTDLIDPQAIVDNKTTLLEHLTGTAQSEKRVTDSLIEEYSKQDKDLRLLTYRILLEKYNKKYQNLLPEQKLILKEFIVSVNSSKKLQSLVNEEFAKIKKEVTTTSNRISDEVTRIKLNEIVKSIPTVGKAGRVEDVHLINLLQYYELLAELRSL
jgi:flagellar basal body-associated protein FliL